MKISVVTTSYNSGATIQDTIQSVLRQTYHDVEYIIVDGRSSDNTMDIVRAAEPLFQGRMSTGDVVGILNSDDYFTSDSVLCQIAAAFNHDTDAVYGDIHFVSPQNLGRCVRYYSSRYFRPWMLRFGYMPAHPSFYARRNVYTRYGLYSLDYKIASDFDMMARLFCRYNIKTRYLSVDCVTMRTGGVSTRSIANRLLITREDAAACRRNGIYSNVVLCSFKYVTKIFEFLRLS